jgi:Family of unknown function (DUF6477)
MNTSDDQLNPTPFLMPLRRQPQATPRRIVGFRPVIARYNRTVDLVRLLPLWPDELADSIADRTKLVQMLERALRAERQRGAGGHWTYDLSRHACLMWALRAERAALKALTAPRIKPPILTPNRESLRNTVAVPQPELASLP